MPSLPVSRSVLIAIVIAMALGLWLLSGSFGASDAPRPQAQGDGATAAPGQSEGTTRQSVRVQTIRAQSRASDLVLRGRTEAVRDVELRAETAGAVAALPVEKGALVQQGEIICQLAVEARDAQLTEAKALLRQRALEVRAAEELAARGFRSETQVAQARAAVEAAQANVRRMEIEVDRTRIRAPFNGVLDQRPAEVGDYLRTGDTCGVVIDPDPLLVVGFVSERDIGKLSQGAPGRGRLVDGTEVEGTVRFIATQAEAATRTFRVELAVPNPEATIRQGITAELRIPIAEIDAHFISPAVLTLNDEGTLGVRTVTEDEIVRFVPVSIIEDTGTGVWVSGLPLEATVITVGQEYVIDGQRVDVFSDTTAGTSS